MRITKNVVRAALTEVAARHPRLGIGQVLDSPDLLEAIAEELDRYQVEKTDRVAFLDVDAPCPVELVEILSVEWNPMTLQELSLYAGIEHTGWISHYHQETSVRDYVLIADVEHDGIQKIQVVWTDATGDEAVWQYLVSPPSRIV